jgi:hypothetical protein
MSHEQTRLDGTEPALEDLDPERIRRLAEEEGHTPGKIVDDLDTDALDTRDIHRFMRRHDISDPGNDDRPNVPGNSPLAKKLDEMSADSIGRDTTTDTEEVQ